MWNLGTSKDDRLISTGAEQSLCSQLWLMSAWGWCCLHLTSYLGWDNCGPQVRARVYSGSMDRLHRGQEHIPWISRKWKTFCPASAYSMSQFDTFSTCFSQGNSAYFSFAVQIWKLLKYFLLFMTADTNPMCPWFFLLTRPICSPQKYWHGFKCSPELC